MHVGQGDPREPQSSHERLRVLAQTCHSSFHARMSLARTNRRDPANRLGGVYSYCGSCVPTVCLKGGRNGNARQTTAGDYHKTHTVSVKTATSHFWKTKMTPLAHSRMSSRVSTCGNGLACVQLSSTGHPCVHSSSPKHSLSS